MDKAPIKSPDLYRETPVRYLGYANELGEAFRSFIGTKWVNVSYGVATLYVLADTTDKTLATFHFYGGNQDRTKKTIFTATDTLTWQMLASVVIPGLTINRVCALSNYLLKKKLTISTKNRKLLVTGIGLAVIPLIIKPIDNLVDEVLDYSLRKIFNK